MTGSSGWLGRYLIPMLRDHAYDPIGLDIVASDDTDIVGSVVDSQFVSSVFRQHSFHAVIHAAALHKPDIVRYSEQNFIDVNVTGALNLLRSATNQNCGRFVFTSTTSLMISQSIREGRGDEAIWLDENHGPLEPRNIYGVTKLAAEGLCRMYHLVHGMNVIVLRTSRFFPEDDDTINEMPGPNLKSNELLNRRATVDDMARAHLTALESVDDVGFGLYLVSAPTPFHKKHAHRLKQDAAAVVEELYPGASELYASKAWLLPERIDRVYDGTKITRDLGFRYNTTFSDVLDALRRGREPPVVHDASYTSPITDILASKPR
ncbi:MAG: NAD(P)-dependent oxidoreductase [Pseudomonadota bacterium]